MAKKGGFPFRGTSPKIYMPLFVQIMPPQLTRGKKPHDRAFTMKTIQMSAGKTNRFILMAMLKLGKRFNGIADDFVTFR